MRTATDAALDCRAGSGSDCAAPRALAQAAIPKNQTKAFLVPRCFPVAGISAASKAKGMCVFEELAMMKSGLRQSKIARPKWLTLIWSLIQGGPKLVAKQDPIALDGNVP